MAKKGYLPSIDIRKLCSISRFYFVLYSCLITVLLLHNLGSDNGSYYLGELTKTELFIIFAIKLIYILFWTWVLDLICKEGYSNISWFIIILPVLQRAAELAGIAESGSLVARLTSWRHYDFLFHIDRPCGPLSAQDHSVCRTLLAGGGASIDRRH